MTAELKNKLVALASKYETADFLKNDPSKFMHQISDVKNQEIVAFLSANLAFGRREQILKHIETILEKSGNDISKWILDEKYNSFFPNDDKSFYRTYTNNSMILFFSTIKKIIENCELGTFFKNQWQEKTSNSNEKIYLHQIISENFPKECNLLSHSKDSAAKKINMFLRWMVRTNSPVDLGLWTWFDKKNLLIPLDVHVMQESTKFGLLQTNSKGKIKSANLKTAIELTTKAKEIFPDDPCKLDFALFGLGVDN